MPPPPPGSPEALAAMLVALGLGAARAVPIVWLVPAFGGRDLPAAVRLGLGSVLAALALPRVMGSLVAVAGVAVARGAAGEWASVGLLGWVVLAAREVLIGATVGLVVSFAFRAAEAAGALVDVVRGANLGEVLAPASETRTSPVGALYLLLASVIFLELGGLGRLVEALARSYDAVPLPGVGGLVGASAGGLGGAAELILAASAKLIESAVGLAAPVMVALVLADLALGAVARILPAAPLYFAAMPLKALLGIGIVLLGLGAFDAALTAGFPAWIRWAERGFALWAR